MAIPHATSQVLKRVKYTYSATIFGLVCVFACGPSTPAKSEAREIVPVHLTASEGTKLVAACTPTGPELCFNAVDDNCNGVIDEGCGVCTGDLQFTIAWGDSAANVDLLVTDPSGAVVDSQHRATASGLTLDHDCPSDKDPCNGQNIENVCRNGADPPKGLYKVSVKLVDLMGAAAPVLVRFGGRVGSRSFGADTELSRAGEEKTILSYELR